MKGFMDRYKAKYKLLVIHKAAIIVLLALGFLFLLNPDEYQLKIEYNPQEVNVPFLKAGDYEIQIIYSEASEGNFAVVSSDRVTDSENHVGMEFARVEMKAAVHDTAVLNIHLEQGTYGLRVWPEQQEQCFETVCITRVQLLDSDHYFLSAVCIMSALCIALLGWYVPVEKYRDALLLIGIGMMASLPMFSDSLPFGPDLHFHLARMEGLYQGLCNGEFPVRINPIQTELFGNLTATMYPQLFLYPAVLPRFFDVSVMLCYKILIVCINVATAIIAFYSIRKITGSRKMAYVASVLYTFSLFRLMDMYIRAALGEVLAMVFLPLVLWGIYEALWGDTKKWYLLVLGITGVIQSHVLSLMMTAIFLALESLAWLAVSVHRKASGRETGRRIAAGIKAALTTCLLNAGFLVPFLFFRGEKLLCYAWGYTVSDYELYFSQMFSLFPFGTGENKLMGSTVDEMPLAVGLVLAAGVILFLTAASREKKRSKAVSLGMHCLTLGGVALLLTSWLFPWESISEIKFLHDLFSPLQFPWRFLEIASLCLCVVSAVGAVMFVSGSEGRNWILGLFMTAAIGSAWFFFDSLALYREPVNDKMELEGTAFYDSLYMYDESQVTDPLRFDIAMEENYIRTLYGTKVRYSDYQKKGTSISSYVEPEEKPQEDEYLIFPLYYYPGYEVSVDGRQVEAVSRGLLVACRMPEEAAYIQVSYEGLTSWRIADIVSVITALLFAGYVFRKHR